METCFIHLRNLIEDKSLSLKDWSEIIKNVFTVLAIIIGGLWALWRYIIFREGASKMEFNLDCNFIGKIADKYLIELVGIMENKGLASQRITDWKFNLRLHKGDELSEEDCRRKEFNFQAVLSESKIERQPWLIDTKDDLYIDSGTVQKYTYLTTIPVDTKFIYIYSSFNYGIKSRDYQSAGKAFSVDKLRAGQFPLDRNHIQ